MLRVEVTNFKCHAELGNTLKKQETSGLDKCMIFHGTSTVIHYYLNNGQTNKILKFDFDLPDIWMVFSAKTVAYCTSYEE